MKNIVVIGAGTMGNGIAHVFGLNNFQVTLIDVSQEQLENAEKTIQNNLMRMVNKDKISHDQAKMAMSHIHYQTSINEDIANADVVIEAVSENKELKQSIFSKVSSIVKNSCILASNTSSISITELGAVVGDADRVIGMHFMNPVPIMPLVEIIRGHNTSDDVCGRIVELTKSLDKTPVLVNDYPGFVSNRILIPMINEAIYALYQGVAGVEEIDQVMKLGMAHPMGPLQLADFIGLDVVLNICHVMYEGFGNPKYFPCPLLTKMVNAKQLGRKSGQGFYSYE